MGNVVGALKTSEGRWHGARYFLVEPVFSSSNEGLIENTWLKMEEWCEKTLGTVGSPWTNHSEAWYANNSKFWFRNENDAIMFVLRWS